MNIVIINCFDTYEHRVDLIHDIFIEEGNTVSVLTSDYRHFEKVFRTEQKKDYLFFNAIPYKKNISYSRLLSHSKLSNDIFKYLENQSIKIDLLWVLVPPNSFIKDAVYYKSKHQSTKVLFDIIDLWPESLTISAIKNVFPFSLWKNLRNNNLRYADIVVTECKLYQHILCNVVQGVKTEYLYLARPLLPYEARVNLPNDRFNLCYLGSINNIIDIDAIVNIIAEFKKCKPVELHIIGDGERKDELLLLAKEAGAMVVYHGRVYGREEKQKIFDYCHYGLNIMKKTVCVGLTMKSMDYMEFGLPLINNIQGDTWDIVEQFGIGINVGKNKYLTTLYDENKRRNARMFFEKYLTTTSFKEKVLKIISEDLQYEAPN